MAVPDPPGAGPGGGPGAGYARFRILLDDPAPEPGLGFGDYAAALAELIRRSRADFAIGIFGGWGSGKTTLMRAIRRRLASDDSVISVSFNAWRYEREASPIIPLLDTLREALRDRDKASRAPWARQAAQAVGRAGRALAAGLTLSAGFIPGLGVDVDIGKVIETLSASDGEEPLSFYHTGFAQLREAITAISGGGTRRVVIFIDDIDRCLPASALTILESVKLLFGAEGCVFVVALDRAVVDKAITGKYGTGAGVSGTEYVKKIFQVPFTLPETGIGQLPAYLDVIEASAGFSAGQLADFRDHVRPHLRYLAGPDGAVNLREVKLLINSYVLQLKVLWPRLGAGLDTEVVLALLCLAFRPGWREVRDRLSSDPGPVQRELRDLVRPGCGGSGSSGPGSGRSGPVVVPPSLLGYLGAEGWPLLMAGDLRPYLAVAGPAQPAY